MTEYEMNNLRDMFGTIAWHDKWRGWYVVVDGRTISNFTAAYKVLETNYMVRRVA